MVHLENTVLLCLHVNWTCLIFYRIPFLHFVLKITDSSMGTHLLAQSHHQLKQLTTNTTRTCPLPFILYFYMALAYSILAQSLWFTFSMRFICFSPYMSSRSFLSFMVQGPKFKNYPESLATDINMANLLGNKTQSFILNSLIESWADTMEKSKPKYCHNKSSLKCKLNLIEVDYIDTNIPKWKETCNKATNANVDPLDQLKYIPNNNKKKPIAYTFTNRGNNPGHALLAIMGIKSLLESFPCLDCNKRQIRMEWSTQGINTSLGFLHAY